MRRVVKHLCLVLAIPLFGGCGLFGDDGYFEDREDEYLQTEMLPPLEIPEDLDGNAIEDLYYVPPIDKYAQRPEEHEAPRPAGLVSGEFDNMVKIQTMEQEQWILVRLLPGQVWPRLEDFLLTRGLGVGGEDGAEGTLQTPWVQDPQTVLQEQYRFKVEQGVQRNTSEVHLVQRQRDEEAANDGEAGPWPVQSVDRQRERLMLQQFANYLANSADANAAVSLMAQGISTSRRLYMVSGEDPSIRVNLDKDRGWASLAYALDKAGFLVDDKNYDQGIYDVSLDPEMDQKKKGFWKRFFGVFTPGKKELNTEERQFKVSMEPTKEGDWQEIRIVNPAAQARGESSPEAQEQMLALIKGYLT